MLTNLQQSTSKATKPETDRISKEEDTKQQAEADRIDDERLAAGPAASKKRKKEEAHKLANVQAGRMNSGQQPAPSPEHNPAAATKPFRAGRADLLSSGTG